MKALILLMLTKKSKWVGMEPEKKTFILLSPIQKKRNMIRVRSRARKKSKWREGTFMLLVLHGI